MLHSEYKPGLDKIEEPVISSHFMQRIGNDVSLELYDDERFAARSLSIDASDIIEELIPALVTNCDKFCLNRAIAAKNRSRANYQAFGLTNPTEIGLAHIITEVMFDRQFLRAPRDTCSRASICDKVKRQIAEGLPIDMVIPALPFKFSSPLKTRGRMPDLGEVNFLLGLYEIAATIELIYREAIPNLPGRYAGFTVVSDGGRFLNMIGETDEASSAYRKQLHDWIDLLRLDQYITLVDYCDLLRDRMPAKSRAAKSNILVQSRKIYSELLDPIFDPYAMSTTLQAAAKVEPDPERTNPEGRCVSLLKSLVFTINYKVLENCKHLPPSEYCKLYRELTGHLFEPYLHLSGQEIQKLRIDMESGISSIVDEHKKEYLRQSMLKEVWNAMLDYIAEIKSGRDLETDPIQTCLPTHIRWTIHAKPGQLTIAIPSAQGYFVQPWTGAAVFKGSGKSRIKLSSLPILLLEGNGATPILVRGSNSPLALGMQPLFYIYPDVPFVDVHEFLATVRQSLVRNRTA